MSACLSRGSAEARASTADFSDSNEAASFPEAAISPKAASLSRQSFASPGRLSRLNARAR